MSKSAKIAGIVIVGICSFVFYQMGWISNFAAAFKEANYLDKTSLIITVLGFAGTGSAALYAAKSAREAREQVVFIDVVTVLAGCIAKMEELKNLQRSSAFHSVPEKYSELKKQIILVRESFSEKLTEPQQITFQEAITQFSENESFVEKRISTAITPKDVSRLNGILAEQITGLQKVYTQLKTKEF